MGIVLILIFAGVATSALAFVAWPLIRGPVLQGRWVLAAALGALVLGIGGGTYVLKGHPELALRSLGGAQDSDLKALISRLAWKIRANPGDPRGWALLARGYLTVDDPVDAAAAFKRAVDTAPPEARPGLLSAYGEALTAASGDVTQEAEAAFREALAGDPTDVAARFYLGQAAAERRDNAQALHYWEGLLADAPADAPWRAGLVARIAMLKGGPPPSIAAMVQRLADRLKAAPNDPQGWQQLVRSYAVLGDVANARKSLVSARRALSGQRDALAALDAEARTLHLQ